MVNFDNFWGVKFVLKFHILYFLTCEELVPFFLRCEELVPNFHKYEGSVPAKNRCQMITPMRNWYQSSNVKNGIKLTRVKNGYQILTHI